jgi:hypothetical protein
MHDNKSSWREDGMKYPVSDGKAPKDKPNPKPKKKGY